MRLVPLLRHPASFVAVLGLLTLRPAPAFEGQERQPPPPELRTPVLLEECDDPNLDARWQFEDGLKDERPFMMSSRWRANVDTADGVCRIPHRREERLGKSWTSGHAWSRREFTYGYFETRMKFVESGGVDNAFWLMSRRRPGDAQGVTCEIDIVEGSHPALATNNLHIATPQGVREFPFRGRRPATDEQGYSTYAVWWTAEFVRWYWNGRLVRSLPNPGCHHPLAVRFSTAVIPAFWGPIDEGLDGRWAGFDYLRVHEVAPPGGASR